MSPWFERQKITQPPLQAIVHYVSASAVIHASRQQVWDFIKPAENSVLVSPDVVRGFRAPGCEGAGEIQVFISMRDGFEHVSAIEVVEEIPLELAITRTLGDQDSLARGRTFLRGEKDGPTVLEHGQYFSLPAEAVGHFGQYERHLRLHCQQYVERVKAVVEQPLAATTDVPPDTGQ